MTLTELIKEILSEWGCRVDDGMPNPKNPQHLRELRDVLEVMGLSSIKNELIANLLEGDNFKNPALNKVVRYKDVHGEDAEGKVGNLMRRPSEEDAHQKAVSTLGGEDSDRYKEAMNDLGGEGQPKKKVEKEKGNGEGGTPSVTGTAFDTTTDSGREYIDSLPDNDPASEEELDELLTSNFLEGSMLLEAEFTPIELAKTKYQTQWLDHIKNEKPFQLEPYGEIIIDKSFLKSNGYGDKSLEQVLSGGGKDDIEKFFKDGRSFGNVIPTKDGKKYKLTDISKSTFTGQGGGEIPKDAAYYEMGICVEYNKLKGMNVSDAMKAAVVDPKKYQKYEAHLTETCSKIAKNLPDLGSALKQTGGDKYTPATQWPSSDGTPKTDIYGGPSHRISVKKEGGSQLASGKGADAKGLFLGGLSFYETHSSPTTTKYLQSIIQQIESDFKSFNTDNEVGNIRDKATNSYIKWRIPQIKNQTNVKDVEIEKHARAEAIAVGIAGASGKWESWFVEGVDVLTEKEVLTWFDTYWKSQGSKELQEEARDIVNAAINHKRLDAELKKAFNDTEFKKWVVYEAASGNFKFSGNPDLNSANDAIANEILVFNLSGGIKVKKIDAAWAAGYASNVTPNVNFKSSGRQKYTALRLVQESKDFEIKDFQNDLMDIMNEEVQRLDNVITESVEIFNDLITEINFGQIVSKIKKVAQKLLNRILDTIKNFYNNVIKKVIKKLQEYIKLGISKFLEYIGVEVDGDADLSVNF